MDEASRRRLCMRTGNHSRGEAGWDGAPWAALPGPAADGALILVGPEDAVSRRLSKVDCHTARELGHGVKEKLDSAARFRGGVMQEGKVAPELGQKSQNLAERRERS